MFKGNSSHTKTIVSKAKGLETLLVIVLALTIIFWFTGNRYVLLSGILIGIIGLFSSNALNIIHKAWMKLSEVLGLISGKLLLSIVYILLLIPLSVLFKKFGKSSIQLKRKEGTYYTERNHTYRKEDLENLW